MDMEWAVAWRSSAFRRAFLLGCACALPLAMAVPCFFSAVEARTGSTMSDPLLNALVPHDVSVLTFTVLYTTIGLVLFSIARRPLLIVRGLHAYLLMLVLRACAMWLITLEPPPGIIPLIDPITAVFYPGKAPFLKDLFFSGHTATLALAYALAPVRWIRWWTFMATVLIAAFVLLQHVHWTVDVLAAPVAVLAAWKGSAITLRWCGLQGFERGRRFK